MTPRTVTRTYTMRAFPPADIASYTTFDVVCNATPGLYVLDADPAFPTGYVIVDGKACAPKDFYAQAHGLTRQAMRSDAIYTITVPATGQTLYEALAAIPPEDKPVGFAEPPPPTADHRGDRVTGMPYYDRYLRDPATSLIDMYVHRRQLENELKHLDMEIKGCISMVRVYHAAGDPLKLDVQRAVLGVYRRARKACIQTMVSIDQRIAAQRK